MHLLTVLCLATATVALPIADDTLPDSLDQPKPSFAISKTEHEPKLVESKQVGVIFGHLDDTLPTEDFKLNEDNQNKKYTTSRPKLVETKELDAIFGKQPKKIKDELKNKEKYQNVKSKLVGREESDDFFVKEPKQIKDGLKNKEESQNVKSKLVEREELDKIFGKKPDKSLSLKPLKNDKDSQKEQYNKSKPNLVEREKLEDIFGKEPGDLLAIEEQKSKGDSQNQKRNELKGLKQLRVLEAEYKADDSKESAVINYTLPTELPTEEKQKKVDSEKINPAEDVYPIKLVLSLNKPPGFLQWIFGFIYS